MTAAAYARRVDLVPHGVRDRAAGAGGLDDLIDDPDLDGLVDAAGDPLVLGGVDKAVEIGVVDEVVEPHRTRSAIAAAFRHEIDTSGVHRGRHGNIPL